MANNDKTISKLKKDLWNIVSKYVRLSHADEYGYNTCYTCGIRKPYKEMQAGHGFSGRANAYLYELDIIRPQCYGCNICNSGKLDVFVDKLRIEHGTRKFNNLWRLKRVNRKFTTQELKDMIRFYRDKLEHLKTDYIGTRAVYVRED